LGKGITAASIGRILVERGYKVVPIKIDPYINIDAGTMNPFQHGEVYVLKDGSEVDLDLGHYERFLDVDLTGEHNITTGKIYREVIEKERKGEYLGKTVQIIPHITDEIKSWIRRVANANGADVCLVEIGGTVGDIESMPFLEAVRQMHIEEGHNNLVLVHVTLVPIDKMGEQKTKPTQHSVKALRELGLQPDAIVGRCLEPLTQESKDKIALFCDVPREAVVSAHDAEDIYEVPLMLEEESFHRYLELKLSLEDRPSGNQWKMIVERLHNLQKEVEIALVGKYTNVKDSYLSIREALKHAGIQVGTRVNIHWVEAEHLETDFRLIEDLKPDGILVPGGFGERGTEGKIMAIKYARENNIPFLGICFGFQMAVVEFSRHVAGLKDAHSMEIDKETPHPVIDLLPEQRDITQLGGTMRLGDHEVYLEKDSMAFRLYGTLSIVERHRHRYEVNPEYVPLLQEKGLRFTGYIGNRMEILELDSHPFYFATQFHPEFKSRPYRPSPPFVGFVTASLASQEGQ